MGKFKVEITTEANKELLKIYKFGRKSNLIKIQSIIKELEINPKKGLGIPKKLKHYNGEIWSRRINKKDRIIYETFEEKVLVLIYDFLGHYNDK